MTVNMQDALEAKPGDLVEARNCAWGGEIVKTAPEMGAVAVRVDDPRFSGIETGVVLGFALPEVELVMRGDA
jgi:hypothetical protein